jgi:hypothetical protein
MSEHETNNVVRRPAQGRLNATPLYGTVSAALDGRALTVNTFTTSDPNWPTEWRTEMELRPGVRTLVATAQHGSRLFTTNASVTFTNNAVDQTTVSHFAEGQLSYRVWKNSLGQTNRVQTFTWDGRNRLIATTELDASNNGYNWSAVYDGLGRRLRTTTVLVTNGVAWTPTRRYTLNVPPTRHWQSSFQHRRDGAARRWIGLGSMLLLNKLVDRAEFSNWSPGLNTHPDHRSGHYCTHCQAELGATQNGQFLQEHRETEK